MDVNIVKTLEKALTNVDAPIGEHWGCGFLTTQNIKDALDLIHRRDAEIDILIRKKEALRDEIAEQQAEIDRLHIKTEVLQEAKEQLEKDVFNSEMNLEHVTYEYELLKQEKAVVKAEAYKEFAERSEKILIEKYKKYHLIANNTQLKEGVDMFYQGRAEAIWECIGVNRNLVKEMTEQM